MGLPRRACLDAEPKRMVLRKAQVIRASFIQEREGNRRIRVPDVRRNQIQRELQRFPGEVIHEAALGENR
ncbi:hypothetical protein RM96_03480 [Cupriavidus sp. IDO]|nr:hypothetical protein RM96_03480 [Cupriavidus sp. IDO]